VPKDTVVRQQSWGSQTDVWVEGRRILYAYPVGGCEGLQRGSLGGASFPRKVLGRNGTPSPWDMGERDPPRGPRSALLRKESAELADERLAVLSKSTEPPWRIAHLRWRPPAQAPSTESFATAPALPSTSFLAPSVRSCIEHPHDPRLLVWDDFIDDLTGHDANPKHGASFPLGGCETGASPDPVPHRSSPPPRSSPAGCPNAVFAGTSPALELDERIPQMTTPATPRRRIHAQPARHRDTPVTSPLPARSAGRRCAMCTAESARPTG